MVEVSPVEQVGLAERACLGAAQVLLVLQSLHIKKHDKVR